MIPYKQLFWAEIFDIVIGKKSDSPDEDKSFADAAFDTIEIYKSLLGEMGFQMLSFHFE